MHQVNRERIVSCSAVASEEQPLRAHNLHTPHLQVNRHDTQRLRY